MPETAEETTKPQDLTSLPEPLRKPAKAKNGAKTRHNYHQPIPVKHGPGRRLKPNEKKAIETMALAGAPKQAIARTIDCSLDTVCRILSKQEVRERIEQARSIVGEALPMAAHAFVGRIGYEKTHPSANPIASGGALRGMGVLLPEQNVTVGVFQVDPATAQMLIPANQDDSNLLPDAQQTQLEAITATNGASLVSNTQESTSPQPETSKPQE